MSTEIEQAQLMAQVAQLYFENGEDQGAIARHLHVSRSSVSRLLSQARQQGIVEIRIHYPLPTSPELECALKDRFGLKEAHILQTTESGARALLKHIGLLTGKFLESNLHDGTILAMSWGNTLYEVVANFQPTRRRPNVQVVQLVGTLGFSDAEIDGANLVRQFAHALNAKYFNLSAPLIVESVETRRALLQEPSIREVLDLAERADIALVGIGALARGASSAVRAKLLNSTNLETIRQSNAVGDICSQYFDLNGQIVAEQINQRIVGLDAQALRRIPRVVGVAVGEHKAKAILGGLRGRLINVLITDDTTATRVLRLDHRAVNGRPSTANN
jgi:DNA-binding transcriptional regulator LsrR (DeoR family)